MPVGDGPPEDIRTIFAEAGHTRLFAEEVIERLNPENGIYTQIGDDSEGGRAEREAIQAIDGEAALCIHCGEFVGLNEPSIPCDGRVLHERCHDAHFGIDA